MIPGMYPRMVSKMLMKKSALHPRSRKTPRGGRMMAMMILQMSLQGPCQLRERVERGAEVLGRVKGTYDAVKGMLAVVEQMN